MKTLIKNAKIVNEGKVFDSELLIDGELIKSVNLNIQEEVDRVIDACYARLC